MVVQARKITAAHALRCRLDSECGSEMKANDRMIVQTDKVNPSQIVAAVADFVAASQAWYGYLLKCDDGRDWLLVREQSPEDVEVEVVVVPLSTVGGSLEMECRKVHR